MLTVPSGGFAQYYEFKRRTQAPARGRANREFAPQLITATGARLNVDFVAPWSMDGELTDWNLGSQTQPVYQIAVFRVRPNRVPFGDGFDQ